MIDKIKNWDEMEETEVGSSGLPKGIYVVKVVAVKDIPEKQYLEIKFDIVKGEYEGFFKRVANGVYSEWSNQGIYRASYKESAAVFFKRFITAVQKSNKNYVWDWNEQSLLNKYFVVVMDEEEYLKDGEVRVSVKCQSVRSIEAYQKGDIKLPGLKKLKSAPVATPSVAVVDDLPF